MEVEPHNHKGIPALAGVYRTKRHGDHREDIDCHVGIFLRSGRLIGGSRNTVVDVGVDFGRGAQNVGVFPG